MEGPYFSKIVLRSTPHSHQDSAGGKNGSIQTLEDHPLRSSAVMKLPDLSRRSIPPPSLPEEKVTTVGTKDETSIWLDDDSEWLRDYFASD